jgi:hypothetical protein
MANFTETDHTCTEATCPTGTYYVTAVDGSSWWKMAGPYDTHQEALGDVRRVYELTEKYDRSGKAHFFSWGTCRVKDGDRTPGNLNRAGLMTQDLLGEVL